MGAAGGGGEAAGRPARPDRRRGWSAGTPLRVAARLRMWRSPAGRLPVEAVLADHRRRTVWRSQARSGAAVHVKADAAPARVARELEAIRAAHVAGVPTPRVHTAVLGRPAVLVLETMPGGPLDAAPDAAWRDAGRLLRALHSAAVPVQLQDAAGAGWWASCHHEVDAATAALVERGLLAAAEAAGHARWLHTTLEAGAAGSPESLLHGDCMPKHVLVRDDRVAGVIDWADARTGDPAWDLAVLTQYEPDRLPSLLEGYAPTAEERARIAEVLPAYRRLRELKAAVWTHDHGYDHRFHLQALTHAALGDGARP